MARSSALQKPIAAAVPASRFTKLDAKGQDLPADASDHVAVRDNTTGLIWEAGGSAKRLKHKQAAGYCKALRLLGKKDWRLPTAEELFLLADRTKHSPAIDTSFFPACQSAFYWTSTPAASAPAGAAWFVSFYNGDSDWSSPDSDFFVRAVRSGQ